MATRRPKLRTEQNTVDMRFNVLALETEDGREHERLDAHFEDGQWWLVCSACGASWSVVDVNNDIGLERIDEGDESCE